MANEFDIIVEEESEVDERSTIDPYTSLSSWVIGRVREWRDYRQTNTTVGQRWDEYYRLWRGIYHDKDKTRKSERSRLIVPALQQAIEAAVAELEEATFGRGRWFDVADDVADDQKEDMTIFRNLLLEDLNQSGIPAAMSEVFLNGAIYGTGIAKVVVEEEDERVLEAQPIPGLSSIQEFASEPRKVVKVKLVPISPREFVIDPNARSVEEALGCAHETYVPEHIITDKQQSGIYRDVGIGSLPDEYDFTKATGETRPIPNERVKIVEYHGKVPRKYLNPAIEEGEEEEVPINLDQMGEGVSSSDHDRDLVEAIVTIANDGAVLRAVENPFTMKDRSIIAYQHDTVPDRFWGRGVAEKGYNPQKALDAELRGRIDAMALAIHPMMAMDATRLPRGGDLSVAPGKTILTNGDPRTVLMPFNFGQVGTNTFAESGELERMVQMATGSMDSAAPVGVSPRNTTSSGMSMILSGAIKRSKRTMANIERMFTSKLIDKAAWRYMQFDPEKYPVRDFKFVAHSTLGIMAREYEQSQLTQLLNTVPPNSPGYWILIRSIYENSSISNREEMIKIIEQMLQQTLNPPEPTPTIEEQLKAQEMQMKQQAEMQRIQVEFIRANAEVARVQTEALKIPNDNAKKEAETMLALAKAEAEELGSQLNQYKAMADAMQAQSAGEVNAARQQATTGSPQGV
jgi:hypothetical protein